MSSTQSKTLEAFKTLRSPFLGLRAVLKQVLVEECSASEKMVRRGVVI
jgi:hypothetical protein